jgi:hypothetical protein
LTGEQQQSLKRNFIYSQKGKEIKMQFRTDLNNNPTAFTTDIAKEAGLVLGTDYLQGNAFSAGNETYYTAKLLGDPITLTIKVIDKIGFYTSGIGEDSRWTYISMPWKLWLSLTTQQKAYTIGQMYIVEGGTTMTSLFPKEPV